jgi:hypothetical protein
MIEYSVGFRGVNKSNDVLLIQNALTVWRARNRARNGGAWLALDGLVGPQTIGAIRDFQSFNGLITDGRIDPNGPTLAQLRAVLGEEAAVFAPVVCQLLAVLDCLNGLLALLRPDDPGRLYFVEPMSGLQALRQYWDLTAGLSAGPTPLLVSIFRRPNVIGDAGVLSIPAGLLLLALMITLLLIMVQSPAFRKAVEIRARELDRLLDRMKAGTNHGFEKAVEVINAIVGDTMSDVDQCKNSPTFTPSPECAEAMRQIGFIRDRIRNQMREVDGLITLFLIGRMRGLPNQTLRTQVERIMQRMGQNAIDLQVELADMRDKCNCPDPNL